jgi:hypothetical protein
LGLLSPSHPLSLSVVSGKQGNSAFNAHGSRLIIIVVKVGRVKIHVAAAVEALRKRKDRRMKLQN